MITIFPKKARASKRAKAPYLPTKVKARTFHSNISYRRISPENFERPSFIIDIFTYLAIDLKPFFSESTYSQEEDREMILMIWNACMSKNFYGFIKKPENFEYLLSQNASFKGANKLVAQYASDSTNYLNLKNALAAYYSIYQYVYSTLFPKYYSNNNKYGIKVKIKFALCYERWLMNKREQQHLGKNPFNFKADPDNIEIFSVMNMNRNQFKLMTTLSFLLTLQILKKLFQKLSIQQTVTKKTFHHRHHLPKHMFIHQHYVLFPRLTKDGSFLKL